MTPGDPGPATRSARPPETGPSGGGRAAVVVVNYESGAALGACVGDLLAEEPAELVVVDNGSSDGSVTALHARRPRVQVVTPGRNLGYGAAANRGVAATSAEYVLVCNPDLSVSPGALGALVDVLDADGSLGVVGPTVRTPDGRRYPSARRFPSLVDAAGHAVLGLLAPGNRFTRSYQQADADVSEVRTVDWVSGACFLARRSAFEQVGGFDEAYFMYAEDADLCWRLGRAGWGVAYVPAAEVTHVQGLSTDRRPYRMILEHHRSLLRFAGRTTRGWRRLLLPLVAAGIALRTGIALARKTVLPRGS